MPMNPHLATVAVVTFMLTGLGGCKILALSPDQDMTYSHLHSYSECAGLTARDLDHGAAAKVHQQAPAHF